jgi:hypothetical protein
VLQKDEHRLFRADSRQRVPIRSRNGFKEFLFFILQFAEGRGRLLYGVLKCHRNLFSGRKPFEKSESPCKNTCIQKMSFFVDTLLLREHLFT